MPKPARCAKPSVPAREPAASKKLDLRPLAATLPRLRRGIVEMGQLVEKMRKLLELFPLGQGQRLAAFFRVGDEQFRQHRRPPTPGRLAIMLAHRRAKHLRSVA